MARIPREMVETVRIVHVTLGFKNSVYKTSLLQLFDMILEKEVQMYSEFL